MKNNKNKLGQYFTPKIVADFMIELADIASDTKILEPACGEGIFLECLKQKGFHHVTAYEIDQELAKDFTCVRYQSFVSAKPAEKFDLIIGNPPYIRWKNLEEELKQELAQNNLWSKYFNSLCDYLYIFILKSIELLNDNGQLIFICPEYWMNTTHAITLRNYMVKHGYFEEIYHFNETPIFDKVTVSIVIFKYIKSTKVQPIIQVVKLFNNQKLTANILNNLKNKVKFKQVEYIEVPKFKQNSRWILQPLKIIEELQVLEKNCVKDKRCLNIVNDKAISYNTIGDVCEIGNGLVSGLDKAFRVENLSLNHLEKKASINVVKAKDLKPFVAGKISQYIFITAGWAEGSFKEIYPNYFKHLQQFKSKLGNRYQYNRKINYWEWVFLRNFNLFKRPERRIFVPCKERISNKNYFRFALVDAGIFPTQDVTAIFRKTTTKESIEYILAYLNNPIIFDWLKCNGIVKGHIVEFSEKPIASIPFRMIDWHNSKEVLLHNTITQLSTKYISQQNNSIREEINKLFQNLLEIKK